MAKLIIFSTLILYVVVSIAEARLIRTSGRGTFSGNFSEEFYYFDNSQLNQVGIKEDAFFNRFTNNVVRAIGGGSAGIGAVPNDCIYGYTQDDIDFVDAEISFLQDQFNNGVITADEFDQQSQALQDSLTGEPCVWEFEQGEDLFAFGFYSLFFGIPDIIYDVSWNIFGNGVDQTFDGDINPTEFTTPEGTVREGWVTLNTPINLAPGDYQIRVSSSIATPNGKIFWSSTEPGDQVQYEERCEFIDAINDIVCGYNSISQFNGEISDAPTTRVSDSEILRILPSSSNPPVTVSAPASSSIIIFGLALIGLRRRKLY